MKNIQIKMNILPYNCHRVYSNPLIYATVSLDASPYVLFQHTLECRFHVV